MIKELNYAGLGIISQKDFPFLLFMSVIALFSMAVISWLIGLSANSNFNYNRANWRSMPGSQDNEGNYFGRIMSLPPTVRYEDEDGNPVLGPNHSDGNQSYQPKNGL